ncbi:hypothetical protein ACP4OV_019165 [Aristida adscensionis]
MASKVSVVVSMFLLALLFASVQKLTDIVRRNAPPS